MLPFFEWCEASWLGRLIGESVWAFPVLEAIHLLGLSLLGGALLVVDLRLFGFGLTEQPIAQVARGARRWLVVALGMMAATGIPLFFSEAVKCYHNPSFWVKMAALPVALGYTFLVREPGARRPELITSTRSRLLALGSVAVWFTVAAAGRWIGFSS